MINENMKTLIFELLGEHDPTNSEEIAGKIVRLYDIMITEYVRGVTQRIDAEWDFAARVIDHANEKMPFLKTTSVSIHERITNLVQDGRVKEVTRDDT